MSRPWWSRCAAAPRPARRAASGRPGRPGRAAGRAGRGAAGRRAGAGARGGSAGIGQFCQRPAGGHAELAGQLLVGFLGQDQAGDLEDGPGVGAGGPEHADGAVGRLRVTTTWSWSAITMGQLSGRPSWPARSRQDRSGRTRRATWRMARGSVPGGRSTHTVPSRRVTMTRPKSAMSDPVAAGGAEAGPGRDEPASRVAAAPDCRLLRRLGGLAARGLGCFAAWAARRRAASVA